MDNHILRIIQTKIRTLQYRMTLHAEEEMCDDSFSIFEVEQAILNGMITERQKDQVSGEWKYVIHGRTDRGELMAPTVEKATSRRKRCTSLSRSSGNVHNGRRLDPWPLQPLYKPSLR